MTLQMHQNRSSDFNYQALQTLISFKQEQGTYAVTR